MNKYGAKKIVIDNITFHSRKEGARYQELKLLLKGGVISDLEMQVKISIDINLVHVCTYIADFKYWDGNNWIYEDVKGVKTPVYRLKQKLVRALYGIEITET